MIRRWLCLLALVATPAGVEPASALADDWVKVQRALVSSDRDEYADRMRQLQDRARECQARRLTPYAESLVTWASGHPDALGGLAVRTARDLDPELPSSYFLISRWQWRRGDALGAVRSYLAGWWAMFLFEPTRAMLAAAVVPWFLIALGWALLLVIIVQTVLYLPRLAHDAVELMRLAFRPPTAAAVAGAVLVLPLFAGLGPIWLLVYLFVLSWAYMTSGQRLTAVTSCVVLALLFPGLVSWQQAKMRWPSLMTRVTNLLEERRIDYPTVRELAAMGEPFADEASYHVLLGELHRMHGDGDEARVEFQRANLVAQDDSRSRVFLGNMALEDGDVQLAIQLYNEAIQSDPRDALAHRNLSFAYDQSRRFQDGDAARTAAKEIAGDDWEKLGIPGRDPRIRYPELGRSDVRALAAAAPVEARLTPSRSPVTASVVNAVFSPLSMVFWALGLLGVVVLALRGQWMWTAQSCAKCGKSFCPRCKTATESDSFCSQCISVFLKRDGVAADVLRAKQSRVRRWTIWSTAARRVAGILIPGSHEVLDGRPWLGIVTGTLAWILLSGALYWVPMVIPAVDPLAATLPVQLGLGVAFAVLWIHGIIAAWQES